MESESVAKKVISKEDRRKGTSIKRRFWLIVMGFTFLCSGYYSFVTLQSSIRIEDGLGARFTTITYVTQILLNIIVVPILVRLIGVKKSLIVSEVAYIIYVIANVFSEEWLLTIGAVMAGFAESLFWIPVGISFVYFAKQYHPYSTKSEYVCILEFSGYFWGMLQINNVLANLLVTLILSLLNFSPVNTSNQNATTNVTSYTNLITGNDNFTTVDPFINATTASDWVRSDPLVYCGANDCQEEKIIDESIEQYVPSNPAALYALSGFFLLLMLVGMICHIIILPEMPFSSFNKPRHSKESQEENDLGLEDKTLKKVLILSVNATKDLVKQYFHPYQFFVTPHNIYGGIGLGMAFSEMTRAYASCVLGVNQIGFCVSLFFLAGAVHCFIVGKFLGKRGLVLLMVFESVAYISANIFMLLWIPSAETSGLVYVLFAWYGVAKGTEAMISTNIYGGADFYKSKEISFSIWNINFAIGFAIMFGISPILCVRDKIFFCMVWEFVAIVLLIIFQTRLSKNKDEEVKTKGPESIDNKDNEI